MLLGRLLGWLLIGLTVVMASADAVMALGPAEYAGIITAEMVTLLTGGEVALGDTPSVFATLEAAVLDLPAWVAVGAMGIALLVSCRKRHRKFRFRRG